MLPYVRHAWRSWKNNKGLAVLAVAALSTGIGCATAIFTVVDAVMLKPLPYSDAGRWVVLFGGDTHGGELERYSGLSLADLDDYQQRTHSFDVFGWYRLGGDFNLTSPGEPRHVRGAEVTPSLVDNVGIRPTSGRLFNESDGPQVALLSTRLWRQMGANPELVGKSITLNGESYTVTGIVPPKFRVPIDNVAGNENSDNDIWIPVKQPRDESERGNYSIYASYARLKPGVTIDQARADARRVASEIAKERPGNHQSYTAFLFSLREAVVKDVRPVLFLLFGAAGLLFLIACGNVTGLMVARSVSRARETAIRIALGGTRRQLGLQFFFEGIFVAFASACLGIVASIFLVRLVVALAAEYIPRSAEISLSWVVVLFVIGIACVAAIASALAPLWQAARTHPNEVLSDGARASAGARSRKLSHALVVAEIALAFTLLSVGAILASQLNKLNRTSPGFDPANLLTFQIGFASSGQPTGKALSAYQDRLLHNIEAIPGVGSAAIANQLPLDGCCLSSTVFPEGQTPPSSSVRPVSFMTVNAGFFKTMRIPLRKGRLLDEHDTNENLIPVVIDESAAKRYWPNSDPVGAFGRLGAPGGTRFQVAGIVGDVRNEGLNEAVRPEIYLLNALVPANPMYFIVRSSLPVSSLAPSIRRAVQGAGTVQPIYNLRTMNEVISSSLTFQRLDSVIITFFAFAALLMASLGIYGLISYGVRRRTVELGTRMALGATGRDLMRLVVGSGLKMSVYGMLIGGVAVAAVSLAVARNFHIRDIGPLPYLYSILVVAAVAALASIFPAWRASLLSPMAAIRDQTDSVWATARRGLEQAIGLSSSTTESASESDLLTEIIEAGRHVSSFSAALQSALAAVAKQLRAESVLLLERTPSGEYCSIAAVPEPSIRVAIPSPGFLSNRLRFYSLPLALTPEDLDTALRWASNQKPEYVAEINALQESGVRLAVGLRVRHEVFGLLLLGAPVGRSAYNTAEKHLLQATAGQFALMIENARLTDRIVEEEKLHRDLELAAEVQRRLLPQVAPAMDAGSLDAFTLPVRSVGGDYYDFLNVGNHRIGIALADVAGKGIAAALITAVVHASLRGISAERDVSLPELAARMNAFLHRSTGASSYATFFYAQLDEEKRQLRYVNAGHNPPYLIRSNGNDGSEAEIEELATGGMIIGMFPIASYKEAAVDLRPGDVLLAFTDGVTEAMNPTGEEFGEDRLKSLLRRIAPLSVAEITSAISAGLRAWMADAPQHDDVTFIVMKVNP